MRAFLLLLAVCAWLQAEEEQVNVVDGMADRILSRARAERAAGLLPPPERYPTTDLTYQPPWLRSTGWERTPWHQLERREIIQVLDLLYKHAENQWYTNMNRYRLGLSIQEQLDLVGAGSHPARDSIPTLFVGRWSQVMERALGKAARERTAALDHMLRSVQEALARQQR